MITLHKFALFTGRGLALIVLLLATQLFLSAGARADGPDKVYVTVGILDIDAISSADQSFTINVFVQFRWQDDALAHDGEGNIRRALTGIPAPRFLLINRQKTWSSLLNVVDISPGGEAVYRMRVWGDFSQPLRLHNFPFDAHDFKIPIVALSQDNAGVLPLVPDPREPSFMAQELSVADWSITEWSGDSAQLDITGEGEGNGFVFRFRAERIYNHHVIKFIIPLILIVAMSWVVFWIDPEEAGSQLSVAVTATLTLIAYHIALAGKLPDIPYLTRMDLFLFGSTLLVFTALLEVVITSRLARSGMLGLARGMDWVCRLAFPVGYVVIAGWALGIPDLPGLVAG